MAAGVRYAAEVLGKQAQSAWKMVSETNGDNGAADRAATAAQEELRQIEQQIAQLDSVAGTNADARRQLHALRSQLETVRKQIHAHTHAWRITELARHPQRPYMLDYVQRLFTDFSEIHGDRAFADDQAIVCGMATYHGQEVMIIGQQKGRDTKQKLARNWGMPNPEGYRKALRAMKMAEKFRRPVIAFIDTPAAYPGIESEERGISEAIALNLREMAALDTPIVVVIHGEGGSGGALGLAVGDTVLMHEFAIYSVIPPEGCAAILWRDSGRKVEAADALKLTAPDLLRFGIIDEIIPEPTGGAHTNHELAATLLDTSLERALTSVAAMEPSVRLDARYQKWRAMGNAGLAEG